MKLNPTMLASEVAYWVEKLTRTYKVLIDISIEFTRPIKIGYHFIYYWQSMIKMALMS